MVTLFLEPVLDCLPCPPPNDLVAMVIVKLHHKKDTVYCHRSFVYTSVTFPSKILDGHEFLFFLHLQYLPKYNILPNYFKVCHNINQSNHTVNETKASYLWLEI